MSRVASAAILFKRIMLIQIVKSASQGSVRFDSRNKTRLWPEGILLSVKCIYLVYVYICLYQCVWRERERERKRERSTSIHKSFAYKNLQLLLTSEEAFQFNRIRYEYMLINMLKSFKFKIF